MGEGGREGRKRMAGEKQREERQRRHQIALKWTQGLVALDLGHAASPLAATSVPESQEIGAVLTHPPSGLHEVPSNDKTGLRPDHALSATTSRLCTP